MLYEEIKEYFKDNDIDNCASSYFYLFNIKKHSKRIIEIIDDALKEKDMKLAWRMKNRLIDIIDKIEESEAQNISVEQWQKLISEHYFSK